MGKDPTCNGWRVAVENIPVPKYVYRDAVVSCSDGQIYSGSFGEEHLKEEHYFVIYGVSGWGNEDKQSTAPLNRPYYDTNRALFSSYTLSMHMYA